MGSNHYPQIPFILIMTNQSELLPLLVPDSSFPHNPLVDLQDPHRYQYHWMVSLSWFPQPTLCHMLIHLLRLFLVLVFVRSHHIAPSFCDLSSLAYCQGPHWAIDYTFFIVFYFYSYLEMAGFWLSWQPVHPTYPKPWPLYNCRIVCTVPSALISLEKSSPPALQIRTL